MKRIAIDCHVVDMIADIADLLEKVQAAAKQSHLRLVCPYVIHDELAATTNKERRERLLQVYDALPKDEPPVCGTFWGVTRYGLGSYGDGSESGVSLDKVLTSGDSKYNDAMLATTASGHADVLVTNDAQLRKRVKASTARCEVWSLEQFKEFIAGASD